MTVDKIMESGCRGDEGSTNEWSSFERRKKMMCTQDELREHVSREGGGVGVKGGCIIIYLFFAFVQAYVSV